MKKRQKEKLLSLLRYLKEYSDELHPVTTKQICYHLSDEGISCDRRTVPNDIEVLNSNSYEIKSVVLGKEKGYYLDAREFSLAELQILVDSIQAANFLPRSQSQELVEKLSSIAGPSYRNDLRWNCVYFNYKKHNNSEIYQTVQILEKAIREEKPIRFQYYDLDENKKVELRKKGALYEESPLSLVHHSDYYYLASYNEKHKTLIYYRLDRMVSVELVESQISEDAKLYREQVSDWVGREFNMYQGELRDVILEFDKPCMKSIYDMFGEDIEIQKVSENKFRLNTCIHVSPTFWGWLFQFDGAVQLISPNDLIEEYQTRLNNVLNNKKDFTEEVFQCTPCAAGQAGDVS